jgi:hypothetical protein
MPHRRINPAFEKISGYREAKVLGQNPPCCAPAATTTPITAPCGPACPAPVARRNLQPPKNSKSIEQIRISAIHGDDGQVSSYVSISSDISALQAAHHQVNFLSSHHPLTGLPNRTVFNDRMQQAIASARRDKRQLAVLLFNIDRLGRVNGQPARRRRAARGGAPGRPAGRPGRALAHPAATIRAAAFNASTDDVIVAARRLIDDNPAAQHQRARPEA